MKKGRPKNPALQEKTKSELMLAAKHKLAEKQYKSITIRELAEHANTQSAMISYYFGSKFGLVEAVVKQTATERKQIVQDIVDNALVEPNSAIEVLVERISNTLLKEPWLFKLLQDDTLAENDELKQLIVSEFSNMGANGLSRLFSELRARNIIEHEVNVPFFMALLVSLLTTPITAPLLLKIVAGFEPQTMHSAEWKKYVCSQLKLALAMKV